MCIIFVFLKYELPAGRMRPFYTGIPESKKMPPGKTCHTGNRGFYPRHPFYPGYSCLNK
jgi:hypothetical protein